MKDKPTFSALLLWALFLAPAQISGLSALLAEQEQETSSLVRR